MNEREDVCGFALHRGRYCMRPAGHEAMDGRVPRHDSTGMPPKTCWRSECRNGCYYPVGCSEPTPPTPGDTERAGGAE
jgi:hypothetical protein